MPDERIDRVLKPFCDFGALDYGEAITQLEHALQCAQLAREAGSAPPLIAAALLHDIGQFMADAGHAAERDGIDARHEETGADFLQAFFGPAVTKPVRLHVAAKRYLCLAEPGYHAGLSRASQISLAVQGGPMSQAEAAEFARDPWFAQAIALRRFDDAGKRRGWAVPALASHRRLLAGLLLPDC